MGSGFGLQDPSEDPWQVLKVLHPLRSSPTPQQQVVRRVWRWSEAKGSVELPTETGWKGLFSARIRSLPCGTAGICSVTPAR